MIFSLIRIIIIFKSSFNLIITIFISTFINWLPSLPLFTFHSIDLDRAKGCLWCMHSWATGETIIFIFIRYLLFYDFCFTNLCLPYSSFTFIWYLLSCIDLISYYLCFFHYFRSLIFFHSHYCCIFPYFSISVIPYQSYFLGSRLYHSAAEERS